MNKGSPDKPIKFFEENKEKMSTTPVIKPPNFTKPFKVECDADEKGFGAFYYKEDDQLLTYVRS